MKKMILALIILTAVNANAGFLEELEKVRQAAEVIKEITGKTSYTCVARTPFDGSFTGYGRTESDSRALAQNLCLASRVSWVFCDDIKCTKSFN